MLIKKSINSIKYGYMGIKKAFGREFSLKMGFAISIIVLFFSIFIFDFSYIELIIVLLCISSVLVTEMINTAIEHTWNHLEPNHHPVVKTVKDIMAGASLLAAIFTAIIWFVILFNK